MKCFEILLTARYFKVIGLLKYMMYYVKILNLYQIFKIAYGFWYNSVLCYKNLPLLCYLNYGMELSLIFVNLDDFKFNTIVIKICNNK